MLHIIVRILRGGVDLVSILLHPLNRLLNRGGVRILCYHRVCDVPVKDELMSYLSVSPAVFARQMSFLASHGYKVITLEQFLEQRRDRAVNKAIIITFDDGYKDNYLYALPVLEEYSLRGTFFISTDYISSHKVFPWLRLTDATRPLALEREDWLPLNRDEILDMSRRGAVIGSHAQSHTDLNNIEPDKAAAELAGSKDCLEEMLAKPVRLFSYPFGEANKIVKDLVKAAGYEAAVTTEWGGNTRDTDLMALRRITIEGTDSMGRFVRKVDGAYDWWFGGLLQCLMAARAWAFRAGKAQ